ncbi:MAG: cell division protein SepF [Bacillota bacterium]|nr:cell division protein SepF [Bacillota bacterium]
MANILNKITDMIFGPEDYNDDFIEEPEEDEDIEKEEEVIKPVGKRGRLVNINTTTQFKVVVMQPVSFDDVKEVADNLKTKKPVIVNLEKLEKDQARRMVDFVSGAAYSLDGEIQKISNMIFLVTPYNVGILGDFKDELKSKGIFPWSE